MLLASATFVRGQVLILIVVLAEAVLDKLGCCGLSLLPTAILASRLLAGQRQRRHLTLQVLSFAHGSLLLNRAAIDTLL